MRMNWIATSAAVLTAGVSFTLASSSEDTAEVVRLKVGTELVVELDRESFDEAQGIQARRLDDGSHLDLRWDQIHPEDVRRIRATFGYLPDEPEAVLVEAVRITLSGGTQLTGRIESSDGQTFRLRMPGKSLPIRWDAVRRREDVRVDALEVYDGEDLYVQRLSQSVPNGPLENYNVALYCESLQLWGRVKEHLDVVVAADSDFKAAVVDGKLKRAELRLRYAADADLLAQAERLAKRDRYDDALGKIDGFLEENPGTSLLSEFMSSRRSIEVRRAKWLRGKINSSMFFHVDRFAHKIAGASDSVEAARKEMEKGATEYALDATASQFEIEPEEARKYWEAEDRPRGSPRTVTYGSGSFTLGEKLAFEGMEKALPESKPKQETESESSSGGGNSVQDRIRKMLEERRKQQERKDRGNRGPKQQKKFRIADVPPDKDEWWNGVARAPEKKAFLLGWWAEKEEMVRVLRITSRPCVRCSGKGVLETLTSQGGEQSNWCPRCKGLRIDRTVSYN